MSQYRPYLLLIDGKLVDYYERREQAMRSSMRHVGHIKIMYEPQEGTMTTILEREQTHARA